MKKNKYLEELGLKRGEYGNFPEKGDKRRKKWKRQRKKYSFDERETWSLNDTMVEWLYSRLMMYIEIGGKVVDLDYHTFEYNGKTFTERQAIDFITEKCRRYLVHGISDDDIDDSVFYNEMTEALHLLAEIFPSLWW